MALRFRSGRRRRGRGGLGSLLKFRYVFLENHRHVFRRLGPDAHPVLAALGLELHALVGVLDHRVVRTQLLDDPAIARLARIDGYDTEIGPMLATHHLHANPDSHDNSFLKKRTSV